MAWLALTQLTRGIRSHRRNCLFVCFTEETVMVSLRLISIFPLTIPIFFSQQLFPIELLLISCAGHPPSVNKGIKGPSLPYLPANCLQKATAVSFPFLFIFSSTIVIFSHSFFFPINCYSVSRTGCPPLINKGIKGPSLPCLPANDTTPSRRW